MIPRRGRSGGRIGTTGRHLLKTRQGHPIFLNLKMKHLSFKTRLILCLCLFGLLFLFDCSKKEKAPSTLAPDFKLETLEGEEIRLSSLKGRVVLLDFWATWCAPCREAIPHLVHLYKTYHEKGLEVIGMNMDKGDIDVVRRFAKSMDIPYPVLVTPHEVSKAYGVTGLPTTIIVDREGKIRQKFVGFTSQVSKQITSAVAELTQE